MLNPDKKKLVQNELADAPQLDNARLEQLFADIYAIQDSEAAKFIQDCLANDLSIIDMKRLALIRGFTSNKEVLLAYEISQLASKEKMSCWANKMPIWWLKEGTSNHKNSKKDFKDYLNVINKTIDTQNTLNHKPIIHNSDKEEMARIAYEFCYYIDKKDAYVGLNKRLDLEEIIMQSPKFSFLYACNVLEGPWPEAEENIKKDGFWWGKYTSFFK